jgi:hypothetical protein
MVMSLKERLQGYALNKIRETDGETLIFSVLGSLSMAANHAVNQLPETATDKEKQSCFSKFILASKYYSIPNADANNLYRALIERQEPNNLNDIAALVQAYGVRALVLNDEHRLVLAWENATKAALLAGFLEGGLYANGVDGYKNMSAGMASVLSEAGRHAAQARHNKPGGSRDKQKAIRDFWASGKYTSRDRCAEEECAALDMSFSSARKALRNTPEPI